MAEPKGQSALDSNRENVGPSSLNPDLIDTASPKTGTGDVGTALRDAFRATVDEDVPAEMLDLLRRLD